MPSICQQLPLVNELTAIYPKNFASQTVRADQLNIWRQKVFCVYMLAISRIPIATMTSCFNVRLYVLLQLTSNHFSMSSIASRVSHRFADLYYRLTVTRLVYPHSVLKTKISLVSLSQRSLIMFIHRETYNCSFLEKGRQKFANQQWKF